MTSTRPPRLSANRPVVNDFCDKLCKCCENVKESSCKQYAYSLSFLKHHLPEDWEDVDKVLYFLKDNLGGTVTKSRRA